MYQLSKLVCLLFVFSFNKIYWATTISWALCKVQGQCSLMCHYFFFFWCLFLQLLILPLQSSVECWANWHLNSHMKGPPLLRAVLDKISSCELFPDVHMQSMVPLWAMKCVYSEKRELLLPFVAFPALGCFSQAWPLKLYVSKGKMRYVSSQIHVVPQGH